MDLPDHTTTQDAVDGGVIRTTYEQLWDLRPFTEFLPATLGGGDGSTRATLALLDVIAYHHLPLSLSTALTGALFILPLARFGTGPLVREALASLDGDGVRLGGMMMTEPRCGTDLFAAHTTVSSHGAGARIRGEKHWSGLTGHADWWLVFARRPEASRAGRYGYHLVRASGPGKRGLQVREHYRALGLSPIPYGRTELDCPLEPESRLGADLRYSRVVAAVLHGSRLTFAGMSHGAIRGALDRGVRQAEQRRVAGVRLSDYDQVQARLDSLRCAEYLTRAMCLATIAECPRLTPIDSFDRTRSALIKALATELLFDAADHAAVLHGGNSFRADRPGFRQLADSYPFRIFEGPNDVLFDQACSDVARSVGSGGRIGDLFARYGLPRYPRVLDSLWDRPLHALRQRDRVALGRAIAIGAAWSWVEEYTHGFSAKERVLTECQCEALLIGTLAALLCGG